jgi:hypothetical protein
MVGGIWRDLSHQWQGGDVFHRLTLASAVRMGGWPFQRASQEDKCATSVAPFNAVSH